MQSIEEIAEAINSLTPIEMRRLMEQISEGGLEDSDEQKLRAIQDAMKDELFLADLHEVMDDFSHVDGENPAT